jgi:hypothetical protein
MKGVETTIPRLIVAVIICLVFFLILFPAVQKVWAYIQEKFGLTSLSPLEKAVLCAYYRCMEGCAGDNTNEYCSDFWVDACNKPEKAGLLGSDLKVCDWASEQYPVELKDISEQEIKKQIHNIEFDCIYTDDSNLNPTVTLPGPMLFLRINKALLKNIKREDCSPFSKAVMKATISANKKVFISMPGSSYGPDWMEVDVYDNPKYIVLTPGVEKQVSINAMNWNRIAVEGVGDVLVKLKSEWGSWTGLYIKCPSDTTVDISLQDCRNGVWLCDNNFFIKCTDTTTLNVLYKSPATGGAAGPKK